MWLSFTSTMSKRPMRWLEPPPTRTAYFCKVRKPGTVLRVSRTLVLPAFKASWKVWATVATPESCWIKFKSVRSPVKSSWVVPSISAIRSPFFTTSPSFLWRVTFTFALSSWNTSSITGRPASTPSSLAIKRACCFWSAGIVHSLVTSPVRTSSAKARRIMVKASSVGKIGVELSPYITALPYRLEQHKLCAPKSGSREADSCFRSNTCRTAA